MMRTASLLLAATLITIATGCGGNVDTPTLEKVGGKVTLDGEPIEGAIVEFIPASGRPSMGVTDADGNYSLLFRAGTPGAMRGPHTVRITSQRGRSGGEGGEPLVEARAEMIPQKYNDQSTLSVEVKAGSNTHDFPLEGKRDRKSSPGA